MSNASITLNKVKAVLGLEVKMEQLKMENGTILEADSFEVGQSVFIVTEDEKVALPVGEYELEDDRVLRVEEEGVIASLEEEADEEVAEEEVAEEEQEMEYVSRQEFNSALDEMKAMIDEIKAAYDKKEEEMSKEVEEEPTESEEQEELKAELSKPASAPLKHSPEKVAEKQMVRFAQNRPHNVLDKVFQNLTK